MTYIKSGISSESPDPVNFSHQHHFTSSTHSCADDQPAVHFITAEMHLRKSAELSLILKIYFKIILSVFEVERSPTRPLIIWQVSWETYCISSGDVTQGALQTHNKWSPEMQLAHTGVDKISETPDNIECGTETLQTTASKFYVNFSFKVWFLLWWHDFF